MPDPDLISRLTRSPRAMAGLAGVLLIAAVVVIVVLVTSGGSSTEVNVVSTTPLQHETLPPLNPHRQNLETIFTEGTAIYSNPTAEIEELHALGVDRVRVSFPWDAIAPDANSRTMPHFDAANPSAYPPSVWVVFDEIVRLLTQEHMGIDLVLAPPPPLWASGTGAPAPANTHPYWMPKAKLFGQFVEAVGRRYSGHYTPPGQSTPLPRVNFWSIWNEPNLGVMLAPQTLNGPTVEVSPGYYRALAGAAWTALQRTGHGHDTTLIGELAPAGSTYKGTPGNFGPMAPLRFLRVLYCVGENFMPLTGHQAAIRDCPRTAAASKQFAAENPVLFHATAYSAHPYPQGLPPDAVTPDEPDYAELGEIQNLFSTLDRAQRAYGSRKRYDVYETEYGYITSPPGTQGGTVNPAKAARWLNWSEYITWRYPRLLSYDQYLLADPPPVPHKPYRRFASGLETYQNHRKPAWYAFRMPIWLPSTSAAKGAALEVWGCVRPAKFAPAATRAPAQIQFKPSAPGGRWTTLATASTKTPYGYFDLRVRFPRSGSVRIRWARRSGSPIMSHVTKITVH